MRIRALAPADAAFATLLLLVIIIVTFRDPLGSEESGFPFRSPARVEMDDLRKEAVRTENLRLNPNRADIGHLSTVPGVSLALAEAIVRFRERHGPFRRLEDLGAVPGIDPTRLERILPYLTLAEEAAWSTR